MKTYSKKQPNLIISKYNKAFFIRIFLSLLLLMFVSNASCYDALWNGSIDKSWFEENNWLGGSDPFLAENTTIVPGSNQPIIENFTAVTPGTLTIAQGATLQLKSGSLLLQDFFSSTGVHNEVIDGTFLQTGGTHSIDGSLTLNQTGIYNLKSGNLNVGDPTSVNNDDNLNVNGLFNQTGGSLFVRDILKITSGGNYNLAGGRLNIGDEDPSTDGLDIISGKFIQTGGSLTFSIHNKFDIRANGQYILEKGDLDTQGENISGVFIQNGGNHNVYWHTNNPFSLQNPESFTMTVSNRYDLNGGTIRADNVDLGSNGTDGVFNQNGGVNRIGNNLNVGADDSNQSIRGTYNLAAGTLIAENENIGFTSRGMFNQTGGTNRVNSILTILPTGTYKLSGGELQAGNLINNGDFVQTGGSISGNMTNNQRYTFSTGSFRGNLSNNGSLIFDTQESETFNVNISGEGSVLKQNSGTINLVGTNSYLGGTTVSNGILRGDTNSLQGDITNNATLTFNQATTGIFNGVITGSGNLTKKNNGLLIFNNTNFYTGGTTINGGNLQVGDADHPGAALPGPVTIGSGGILSGHGSIIGDIQNNGALSPGGSIGTLSVLGNVNFNSGSTFKVEISPQQASLLNVSRNAALGGANVSVLADAGTYTPRSYTILNANTISGNFGNVTLSSATVNPSLDILTPSLQVLQNQGNATLDSRVNLNLDFIANPVGPVRPVIDKWLKTTLRTMGGRLNSPLGNSCPKNSLGFWARGVGMISSADAVGTAPGYDGGTAGTVLGFDGQFAEELSFGLAGFYAHSDVTVKQSARQKSSADSLGLSVYGAYTPGAWQIKGVLGYDNDSYYSQRIGFGTNTDFLGNTHANHVNGYGEISYTFKTGAVSLQPLVGMQLGWMRQKGFTENSANGTAGQNLSIDGRTMYTLDALAGVRARHEFKINEQFRTQTEIRLLYDHDFGTLQNSVTGRINGRPIGPFNSSDRPDQRDAGILGVSLALLSTDSLNLYLDYNGEIRSGQEAHFIGGGIRYTW